MSGCCAEDTCEVKTEPVESCFLCGARGVAVDRITLKALLTSEAYRRGVPPNPRFCATANCPVVYFDSEAGVQFTESDVLEPVHVKRPDEADVPVCYCFGVTPGSIEEEIKRTGGSSASREIAAEVKAGRCACEVRNPKGSCCLGDVIRVEKEKSNGSQKAAN